MARSTDRRSPTAGNVGQGSKWIRETRRFRIYARDGWRCVWCRRALYATKGGERIGPHACLDPKSRALASLDHLVPRLSGGTNHESNLVMSCLDCNSKRGHRSAVEFAFSGELSKAPHVILDFVIDAVARALPGAEYALGLASTPEAVRARRLAARHKAVA